MKRADLAHILRAAADIVGDAQIIVIGSQAVLATVSEGQLPDAATMSVEADIAFLYDPDASKADAVEGGIGEGSQFHRTFGYYAQGVDETTAQFPAGWRDRLIEFEHPDSGSARAVCPEIHDLVISKLLAGREKDRDFATALVSNGFVKVDTLADRARSLDVAPSQRRRVESLVASLRRHVTDRSG